MYIIKTLYFTNSALLISDTSLVVNFQQNISDFRLNYTAILEQQNSKQILQIVEALHLRNKSPNLNKINFEISANVF